MINTETLSKYKIRARPVKISTRVLIFTFIIIGVLAIGYNAQWNKGRHEPDLDSQEEDPDSQISDELTSEQPPRARSLLFGVFCMILRRLSHLGAWV